MSSFHIATEEEIRRGRVADVYFVRTKEILERLEADRTVTMEVFIKGFPGGYRWGIFAGLEEAVSLLEGHPVDVKALPEGTVFYDNEPVMVIRGKYLDFGIFETSLLGMLCQASGVATKAALCRLAAGEKPVISFGARRMHPAVAPMIERAAYIGGCDGVAAIKSAELIGIPPVGTMPHALVLILGDTLKAARAFDEIMPPDVSRIILVDTFQDEKFESVRVAEALGKRLHAVRFDTPSSRRGNLKRLLQETRWELDIRGHNHVRIFVSGGLDENTIRELAPVADAFGVGTHISNAPTLDFSLDIVEIEGEKIAKRGKESGAKKVLMCQKCGRHEVRPEEDKEDRCPCGGRMQNLMKQYIEGGTITEKLPPPQEIRRYVIDQLEGLKQRREA